MSVRADLLFLLFTFLYTLIALASKLVFPELGRPGMPSLIYALLFLGSIEGGFLSTERVPQRIRAFTYLSLFSIVLLLTSPAVLLLSLTLSLMLALFVLCNRTHIGRSLYLTGILLLAGLTVVAPLLAGIPLLEPAARFSRFRFLYLASGYIAVVLLSKKPDWRVLLWGIAIGVLSTFRTVVLGVTLAYILGSFPKERERLRPGPLVIMAIGITLAVLVRYHATLSGYATWHLSLTKSLLYRLGVTYTVYERLFNLGFPWGRGWILVSEDPKLYVGHIFGKDVGYTYTLFGQPAYDLGVLGLLEGIIIGMALRDSLKLESTGTMALTLLTLAVPIGLDPFFFSALMALGAIPTEVVACRLGGFCQ